MICNSFSGLQFLNDIEKPVPFVMSTISASPFSELSTTIGVDISRTNWVSHDLCGKNLNKLDGSELQVLKLNLLF